MLGRSAVTQNFSATCSRKQEAQLLLTPEQFAVPFNKGEAGHFCVCSFFRRRT